eukprot:3118677-Alexandrium_andersonii.AAC.1
MRSTTPFACLALALWARPTFGRMRRGLSTPGGASAGVALRRGRGGLPPRGTQALPGVPIACPLAASGGRRPPALRGPWVSRSRRIARVRGTGAPLEAILTTFARLPLGRARCV